MAVRTTGEKGRVMKSQPNAKKSIGKRISVEVKRHWQLYLMLVLPVTYLIIFAYFPMGGAIIAFKDYSIRGGIWGSEWVGLKHFKNFFTITGFQEFNDKYTCSQPIQPYNQFSYAYPACVGNQ